MIITRCARQMLVPLLMCCFVPGQASAQFFFGEDLRTPGSGRQFADVARSGDARTLFLNAVGGGDLSLEGFESNAASRRADAALGSGVTLSGSGAIATRLRSGWSNSGVRATEGLNYYRMYGGDVSITFLNPVSAFGMFAADVGDWEGQMYVTFIRGGVESTIGIDHSRSLVGRDTRLNGSVLFFGVVDRGNPFDAVRISSSGTDGIALDQLMFGNAAQPASVTPEPLSMVLLGTGLVGLVGVRRRRRGRLGVPA